jgi:hypothetical protein
MHPTRRDPRRPKQDALPSDSGYRRAFRQSRSGGGTKISADRASARPGPSTRPNGSPLPTRRGWPSPAWRRLSGRQALHVSPVRSRRECPAGRQRFECRCAPNSALPGMKCLPAGEVTASAGLPLQAAMPARISSSDCGESRKRMCAPSATNAWIRASASVRPALGREARNRLKGPA